MTTYNCLVCENDKQLQQGAFFSIFNGWVEVPSPPKEFEKFKIGEGSSLKWVKYSSKGFHSEEYL